MPRVTRDAYTKYICVHHFLIGRGTLDRMPLNARSIGSARQTGHTPHGRTSATPSPQRMKILTRKYLLGRVAHERRGQYCFISPTQDTMHYFTQNTPPNPTTKGTPYRVPSGQDPWVWPDNPAYPPQPHLRYPLTSKDEDPNKKILARQSCSRAQRTLLFYLLYNNTTQKTDITS